jgi:hypothetical protein
MTGPGERDVDAAWTPVLAWMFVLAVTFVFVPPLILFSFRYLSAKRRRRMVNAPRKIKVISEEEKRDGPCAGGHERSRRNARQAADGSYVSICRTCGAPMRRNGPGDWVVIDNQPAP